MANPEKDTAEEKEMSFLDHLEELRWHVIRSLFVIVIFTILAFYYIQTIYNKIIFAPATLDFPTFRALCKASQFIGFEDALCIKELPMSVINRTVMGQFTMALVSSFVIGIIAAFPYVSWEIWRFIKPGLHPHERKYSRGAVTSISFLFALGVLFGYYVMSPLAVYFFSNFHLSATIENQYDVTSYVSTIVMLVFGSGLLFQLPVVMYFLSQVGIVTPAFLKKYRKHAIVIILVVAAIITPPDPISQTLITFPLYILYEISIFISAIVARRKANELAKELANEKSYET